MKLIVCRRFTFEAAHSLEKYNGKCRDLHGHSYILYVGAKTGHLEDGIELDTKKLKNIVNSLVVEKLDHKFLNEVLDETPTMEHILQWTFRNYFKNCGFSLC
jgi:6-pyruvoyltetrahydropterin/6-carboxytetrahydropterin synthase